MFGPDTLDPQKARALNYGIGGDRTQHVLWRVMNGEIPRNMRVCVMLCGTNNIDKDTPIEIASGIIAIAQAVHNAKPDSTILFTGLLPRDPEPGYRRNSILTTNEELKRWCQDSTFNIFNYIEPDNYWIMPNGDLDYSLFYKDNLHLVEKGDEMLGSSIYKNILNSNHFSKQAAHAPPRTHSNVPPQNTHTHIYSVPRYKHSHKIIHKH